MLTNLRRFTSIYVNLSKSCVQLGLVRDYASKRNKKRLDLPPLWLDAGEICDCVYLIAANRTIRMTIAQREKRRHPIISNCVRLPWPNWSRIQKHIRIHIASMWPSRFRRSLRNSVTLAMANGCEMWVSRWPVEFIRYEVLARNWYFTICAVKVWKFKFEPLLKSTRTRKRLLPKMHTFDGAMSSA